MKTSVFAFACVLAAHAAPFKNLNESRDKTILEMKKMDAYRGHWVGESHSETANAKISSMICSYENEYVMDGVYFVISGKCKSKSNVDAIESKWMCTFDAFRNKYRMWGFASTGIVLEYEGAFSGGKFLWKVVPGQYRLRGELQDQVFGDSLIISGRNFQSDGRFMERSFGVFNKVGQ